MITFAPSWHDDYRAVCAYWFAARQGSAPRANPLDDMTDERVVQLLRNTGRPGYETHLRSARWREFRQIMLALVGGACEGCGASERERPLLVLDVHHLHYDSLGMEHPDDVEVLCRPCHRERHGR